MAYCRFSKKYDVYCWHDMDDKYHIMMAHNMGKPRDEETYVLDTASECLQKLKLLKREGYQFDQHAIKRLEKEISQ